MTQEQQYRSRDCRHYPEQKKTDRMSEEKETNKTSERIYGSRVVEEARELKNMGQQRTLAVF